MADDDKNKDSDYNKEVAEELEKLKAYRAAIEAEFKDADPEDPETVAKVRKTLFTLIPDAGSTLGSLMKFAESEAVRAGIAKFVFGEALKAAKAAGDTDQIGDLIKQLTKPSAD